MNQIAELIKSLNREEVGTLRHLYLKRARKQTAKRLKLFNLLRKQSVIDEEKVTFFLYHKKHDKRFVLLKSRLLNDVMDILLLHDTAPKYKTPYLQATVECRKMIFQGDILIKRGLFHLGVELLEQASLKAEEFDIPLLQLQADELLFNHKLARDGESHLKEYFSKIKNTIERLRSIFLGQELKQEIEIQNVFHSNIRNQYFKKINEGIFELELLFKLTESPNVGYYFYFTGMIGYRFNKKYEQALTFADSLLNLLKKEKSIYSELRIAMGLLQKSTIYIHLQKYEEAVSLAQQGITLFKKGSFNELRGMEILFEALYYAKKHEEARQVIETAQKHSQFHYSKHSEKKWNFYKNNLLFVLGRYEEMNFDRPSIDELMKDKSGFYPGCKILEIMSFIERNEFIQIEDKLHAFEKTLIRQSEVSLSKIIQNGQNPDLKRIVIIFNLLKFLINKNYNTAQLNSQYDFIKTMEERNLQYNLLLSNKGDYEWNPIGYEYVRFDEWLKKKAEEQVKEESRVKVY